MIIKKNSYQCENLSGYFTIIHGISTKAFGSIKNVKTKEVDREALAQFAQTIGITDEIVYMRQVHSGNVAIVEDTKVLRIAETDGLLTDKKHHPLAILTADCLPIFWYDPKKQVIGIAHAGYRGMLNHIIENTIESMVSHFKSDQHDIIVGIGPSIETLCYEVGVELIEKFQEEFPRFENIFLEKNQKYFLDLRSIARQCLLKEGILKEHIEIMDVCTKCDSNLYSYRGGDGDSRFVSVISLL